MRRLRIRRRPVHRTCRTTWCPRRGLDLWPSNEVCPSCDTPLMVTRGCEA